MPEQTDWSYCYKCHGIFFNGYPDKGHCAAGGSHGSVGYDFVLPHDIPGTANAQADWRYCKKCFGMFFNGYPDKGHCAAGGGHESVGYDFVLPHRGVIASNPQVTVRHYVWQTRHDFLVNGSGFSGSKQVTIFLSGSEWNPRPTVQTSVVTTEPNGSFANKRLEFGREWDHGTLLFKDETTSKQTGYYISSYGNTQIPF